MGFWQDLFGIPRPKEQPKKPAIIMKKYRDWQSASCPKCEGLVEGEPGKGKCQKCGWVGQ